MSGARPGIQPQADRGRQGSQVGRGSQAALHLPGSMGLLGLLSREAKAQNTGPN